MKEQGRSQGLSCSVAVQCRNRLTRELLVTCLDRDPDINVVGSVVSGVELLELCDLRRPSAVVFEADAPRWSNEQLLTLLRRRGPDLRVIGMYDALPAANIVRAYKSGVSALVSHASGVDALITAVKTPSLCESVGAKRAGTVLTQRELEVLYLMSGGHPAELTAWAMGISPNTLDHHKRQIFAKLGVHDQAHAVASAARLGLSGAPGRIPRRRDRANGGCTSFQVEVSGPPGELFGLVHKLLDEPDIRVITDQDPTTAPDLATSRAVTVAVLEDPVSSAQWQALLKSSGQLVIVAAGEVRREDVVQAWSRGIAVISAACINDLLASAVRAAGNGHLVVEAAQARAVLAPARGARVAGSAPWLFTLTPREREILGYVGQGYTMKKTAQALGISVRTVENLQSNLFRKLGVHSRTAALAAAVDLGLLGDPGSAERGLSGDEG